MDDIIVLSILCLVMCIIPCICILIISNLPSNKLPKEDCIVSEWSKCNNFLQTRTIIKSPLNGGLKCPQLYGWCDNYKIDNNIYIEKKTYYRLGLKTIMNIEHIINVFDAIIYSIKFPLISINIQKNNPIILIGNSPRDFSVFDGYIRAWNTDYFSQDGVYPGFINIKYNTCSEINQNILIIMILNIIYYIGLPNELRLLTNS